MFVDTRLHARFMRSVDTWETALLLLHLVWVYWSFNSGHYRSTYTVSTSRRCRARYSILANDFCQSRFMWFPLPFARRLGLVSNGYVDRRAERKKERQCFVSCQLQLALQLMSKFITLCHKIKLRLYHTLN